MLLYGQASNNYDVRHQVVSSGVSSQLVKLFPGHAFYSFGVKSPPNRQASDGTIFSSLLMCEFHWLFPVPRSYHYHLLWPTQKVVYIFLLTQHHKRFGNDGLFLVAHISNWLLCLYTLLCKHVCLFISRNSALGGYPLKGHSAVVAE